MASSDNPGVHITGVLISEGPLYMYVQYTYVRTCAYVTPGLMMTTSGTFKYMKNTFIISIGPKIGGFGRTFVNFDQILSCVLLYHT